MSAVLVGVVVLAGCGRVGFEPTAQADGATSDTLPADAPPASRCSGIDVIMCDGFEQATFEGWWTMDTQSGMLTIDPTRAYRGTGSVHVHTAAITVSESDVRATLISREGLDGGSVTGPLYIRVWAYFASPLPTTKFGQLINFSDDPGFGISFGTRDGFIVNNDYTDGVYAQSTTTLLPTDRWVCLQMTMPSGTTDTARLYADGQEVADVAIPKATPQPNPTHVYLGLDWVGQTNSQPAVDAWFDEVVLDDAPTTCDE